jgi:hypothetical protein
MYVALYAYEPQNYEKAKGRDEWERAIKVDFDAIMKNETSEFEEIPLGKKPIGYKRFYKIEYKVENSLKNYKPRSVAKPFAQ